MSIAGFKSSNHPQQVAKLGPVDDVDDRGTTAEMFGPLQDRFGFTLDAAASAENTKCQYYFTREDDGLQQSWAGQRVWCNPPFSDCGAWVRKAWTEWVPWGADTIVMLLPNNRTEQPWWQDLVEPYRDRPGSPLRVEFLRGRQRFHRPGAKVDRRGDRPPFGCVLLIWTRPEVTT